MQVQSSHEFLKYIDIFHMNKQEDISFLYENPENFWHNCFSYYQSSKCYPFESYSLYHDCIERHTKSELIAYSYYDEERGWYKLSYSELHREVLQLVPSFEGYSSICILLPFSKEWLIAFFSAIYLKIPVSFIQPHEFIEKKIHHLNPDGIYTDIFYEKYIPIEFKNKQIHIKENLTTPPPKIYPKHTVAFEIFSSISQNPNKCTTLSIDTSYLTAIRDALLVYRLYPGAVLSAPSHSTSLMQPSLILSCFLSGATFLDISADDMISYPQHFANIHIDSLILTEKSRKIFQVINNIPLKSVSRLYRSLSSINTLKEWDSLFNLSLFKKTPIHNLFIHNNYGGSLLYSPPIKYCTESTCLPLPGFNWQMMSPMDIKQNSTYTFGIFSLDGFPIKEEEAILLIKQNQKYLFAGFLTEKNKGETCLQDDILEIVKKDSDVIDACLFSIEDQWILLVFSFYEKDMKSLKESLGDSAPEIIKCYPVHPQMKNGVIDTHWCQINYCNGLLDKKAQHPLYQAFYRFKIENLSK